MKKINTNDMEIPKQFLSNMAGEEIRDFHGTDESYKYRVRQQKLRENLFVFGNELGVVNTISHNKKVSKKDDDKEIDKVYNTRIEIFSNFLKRKFNPIFLESSFTVYDQFREIDSSTIQISSINSTSLFEKKSIFPTKPPHEYGIRYVDIFAEAKTSKREKIKSSTLIKIGYYDNEVDFISKKTFEIDEQENIYTYLSELNELQRKLLLCKDKKEIIYILGCMKNLSEIINNEYMRISNEKRGNLENTIESIMTRKI